MNELSKRACGKGIKEVMRKKCSKTDYAEFNRKMNFTDAENKELAIHKKHAKIKRLTPILIMEYWDYELEANASSTKKYSTMQGLGGGKDIELLKVDVQEDNNEDVDLNSPDDQAAAVEVNTYGIGGIDDEDQDESVNVNELKAGVMSFNTDGGKYKLRCWHCGAEGHMKMQCPKRQSSSVNHNDIDNESSKYM